MDIDKVLACIWTVAINGNNLDLDRKRCINSIEISTACDGSDVATIAIVDKDMIFIEDNIFVEDATIAITMMFVGSTDKVTFNGYISAIDIDFPEEGMPNITLTCLDSSHVMNRDKKKRSWDNVTRKDVVQKIAGEYGLKFEGESSYNGKVEDNIAQSDQTDIEFCEKLASEETELYMAKVVGDTLIYKKKCLLESPTMTVHYKQYPYEVRSFNPQINKETMQDKSSVSDIATDTKEVDDAVSTGTGQTQGSKVSGSSTPSSASSAAKSGGSTGQMEYDPSTQTWSKK